MRLSFKGIKALNIRDYNNDTQARKAMGLFKHHCYEHKVQQADGFKQLVEFAYSKGYFKEDIERDAFEEENYKAGRQW